MFEKAKNAEANEANVEQPTVNSSGNHNNTDNHDDKDLPASRTQKRQLRRMLRLEHLPFGESEEDYLHNLLPGIFNAGELFIHKGRFEEALYQMNLVIDINKLFLEKPSKNLSGAYSEKASLLLALGRKENMGEITSGEEIEQCIEKALEIKPANLNALAVACTIYISFGKYDRANEMFDSLMNFIHTGNHTYENPFYPLRLLVNKIVDEHRISTLLATTDKFLKDEVLVIYEHILDGLMEYANEEKMFTALKIFLHNLGLICINMGKISRSLKYHLLLLHYTTVDDYEPYVELSLGYQFLQEWENLKYYAEEGYNRYIKHLKHNGKKNMAAYIALVCYCAMGNAHTGNINKGEKLLLDLLNEIGDIGGTAMNTIYNNLAEIYYLKGNYIKCINFRKKELALYEDENALWGLAKAYKAIHDEKAAIKAYKKALAYIRNSDKVIYEDNSGRRMFSASIPSGNAAEAEKAISMELIDLLVSLRRYPEARKYLQEIKDKFPDDMKLIEKEIDLSALQGIANN